ncbi:MAG: N-acetylmuramoyl-L-alanine amidase [Bacteroidetes bacterium HGW-Bacteroidetes-12]|nr:MAG: N-acetylmuramoyl-L-alanine amidase [Bacteroidetes bacterium HGW-Bacteroidetes-12]
MNHNRIYALFLILTFVVSTSFILPPGGQDFYGIKTVVIDAGHGGKDGGCVGEYSNEKTIALAIALKLGSYIEENFKDVKVIYTRTTDVFIELSERAKIANQAKADLFICVHVNAGSATAIGTETYVMGLHVSEANLRVAKRENSSILYEDDYATRYENFDPNSPESYIAITLRQNAFIDQSLNFAAKVQQQFKDKVGRIDRGVKQAGFLVLHQTNMPSVLIETGFLSNKEEEKFLNSAINQDYMASAIYRAFKDYKHELEEKNHVNEQKIKIESEKELVKSNENQKDSKQNKQKKHEVTSSEDGLIYKIQIATSSVKKELIPSNFNGVENVEYYEAGGIFRYTVGREKSISEANILQLTLREKGFVDAFIVAFNDGKRIALSEAIKLEKE